jgi:predicted Zn-dependent protease
MRRQLNLLIMLFIAALIFTGVNVFAEDRVSAPATTSAPSHATQTFHVVIFKGVDRKMIEETLPMITKKLYNIPFVVLDISPEIPKKAYVEARKQYYAGGILDYLESIKPEGSLGIIGYVNEPIFAGPSPFVDGVGLPDKGTAVLSLAQIRDADYYRFRNRVFSQGLHEMGHVVGLDHDPQAYCVMQETHDLRQLDARATDFCPYHFQNAYKFLKKKMPDLKPIDPFKDRREGPFAKPEEKKAEKKERVLDSDPPELLDIYPSEGVSVPMNFDYIRARLVDKQGGSGVDSTSILLLVDGAQLNVNYTESTGELTARVRNLDPGPHSIELHARDLANNSMNPFFCSFNVMEN